MTRPRFNLRLEYTGEDERAVPMLRSALKVLGRRFGMRCLRIEQEPTPEPPAESREANARTDVDR